MHKIIIYKNGQKMENIISQILVINIVKICHM